MPSPIRTCLILLSVVALVWGYGSLLFADPNPPYSVEVVRQSPPDGLSAAIRDRLADTVYRIKDADGTVWCEIWFLAEMPGSPDFKPTLDKKYPFEMGDLVGALRIPDESDFEDFRQQPIDPGVYTIRYCLQLQDGNHLGTSETRDFFTLQLAEEDTNPARMDGEKMMELSKNAAFSDHPAIMYLMAPPEKLPGKPTVRWDAQHEYGILTVSVTLKGGKKLPLSLVFVGHAVE